MTERFVIALPLGSFSREFLKWTVRRAALKPLVDTMQELYSRRWAIARFASSFACAAVLATPAVADTFPSKAITFVVPYPPGGASDVFARLIAERLQTSLKQPVVVENRAGANGIIAYQQVAKAPADGHTILMANIGPSAINPSIYKKLPYDAIKDFAPITLVSPHISRSFTVRPNGGQFRCFGCLKRSIWRHCPYFEL